MDDFLIRGCDRVHSGFGGTSTLVRGITLPALRLHETAINQWRWGFQTLRGGIDPGNLRLCSRVIEVAEIWMIFLSAYEAVSSPGAVGPRRWPKGHLSRLTGSMRQQPTSGVGVSTTCGADSTRTITVSVPGMLEV